MRNVPYFLYGAYGALLLALFAATLRDAVVVKQHERKPWERPMVERDLDAIQQDTLRVLVLADPLSWEERPHGLSGLEYELLTRFALRIGTPVLAIPVQHPDSMLLALQMGLGDVIAAQATPRRDRRRWVAYTKPYRSARPVLASLRPDPQVLEPPVKGAKAPADIATVGIRVDTAEVSVWSPFADPAYRFHRSANASIPLHLDPFITPEDLLMEVVLGRHSASIVTDARAHYETGRFPVLEFSDPIGPPLDLCFVLRTNSPQLLHGMNEWLVDPAEVEARAMYVKAYSLPLPKSGPLRNKRSIPITGDSISPYDAWFKEHGDRIPWDWQLLTAMAYKESRFDSTVVSRKGAHGIMQIMPRTAERLGLRPEDPMEDHISAATLYLNKLDTMWMRAIPDREQRLRFVLASYNAGPGHIIDAQRLAAMQGLDPGRWEHNVERAVLLLAKPRYYMLPEMKNGFCNGRQVFYYVREVVGMYRQLKGRPPSVTKAESSSMPGSGAE